MNSRDHKNSSNNLVVYVRIAVILIIGFSLICLASGCEQKNDPNSLASNSENDRNSASSSIDIPHTGNSSSQSSSNAAQNGNGTHKTDKTNSPGIFADSEKSTAKATFPNGPSDSESNPTTSEKIDKTGGTDDSMPQSEATTVPVVIEPDLTIETEHFIFYYTSADSEFMENLSSEIEKRYEKVTTELDHKLGYKISVYIYPDLNTFHKALGNPDLPSWYIGEGGYGKISIVSPRFMTTVPINTLTHEMTHAITNDMGSNPPQWLFQGIASYEGQETPVSNIDPIVSAAVRADSLPTFDDLSGDYSSFTQKNGYPFAYSLVAYLVDVYGYDKVSKLIKSPYNYKAIFGIEQKELYAQWVQFLKDKYQVDQ